MRFTFTDRARPFCELGFDELRIESPGSAWDVETWDNPASVWAGTVPVWREIGCDVYEASCEYGRAALVDRFVPGAATVIARNLDGWADPEELSPGRSIRFGVDHVEFGRRILFRGYIDAIVPRYTPGFASTVELQCIDALAELNRIMLRPFIEPINGGETATTRIVRLLDRAQWPPELSDIGQTSWTLIAHEQGGQMADLLSQIADSVGGSVWGDHEGRIVFRGMDWQMFPPDLPLDGIIGNVGPNDICPGPWQRPWDRASISTQVTMGRDAETAVTVNDVEGQKKYGIEPFSRTDLLTESDARLRDLAERTLSARSWRTAPRVRAVSFDARNGDEQLDLMATVDVYKPSHYRGRLFEGGRLVFDDRYIATGVTHIVSASSWTLDLNLDRAFPYLATGGRWDRALWNQATWVEFAEPLLDEAKRLLAQMEAA